MKRGYKAAMAALGALAFAGAAHAADAAAQKEGLQGQAREGQGKALAQSEPSRQLIVDREAPQPQGGQTLYVYKKKDGGKLVTNEPQEGLKLIRAIPPAAR